MKFYIIHNWNKIHFTTVKPTVMKKTILKMTFDKVVLLGIMLLVASACTQTFKPWTPDSDEYVITDYIGKSEDSIKYEEFNQMLINTDLAGFLAIRGPYTLFLPNDDAMEAYYDAKGISGLDGLDIEIQKQLVFNHLILAEIGSSDIGLGAIRETNALGDKVATEFVGSDILINKTAIIIDRDIKTANGYIHEIDAVVEPVVVSMLDLIKKDEGLSIFAAGLELSGVSDTLSMIEFPYSEGSEQMVRNAFTVLAVPDTVFNRYGINSVDELVDHLGADRSSLTELTNKFYQYMEYHCLNGSNYLSDFNTELYPVLSFNNNVLLTIDDDYKINNNSETGVYTPFLIDISNQPAKNGALHIIGDILYAEQPEATEIIFDTCEQFEIMNADYYKKYYMKFYDGQNTFKNIKWEGDYLQYYYKDHDAPVQINFDGLQLIGYWWVEVTTPKVMKGKYKMTGYIWGGRVCDLYVDGVKAIHIANGDIDRLDWGVYEFDTTTEHTVKLVSTSYSTVFWDTIEFEPVLE